MNSENSQTEAARLRDYYAQLSEEELLERGSQYESLTEVAQATIRTEFERRGLPAPELVEPQQFEFQSLVTIRSFRDLADAQLAKAALESAGISAFLGNENTIRVQWLWSNFSGGVSLQVRPEDEAAAEEVLSQPIPPVIESDGVKYEQPRCPACESLDIDFADLTVTTGLSSVFSGELPLSPPRERVCNACGERWLEERDE